MIEKRNIRLVCANVINDGRNPAIEPVLLLGSSKETILPMANVIFSVLTLEKEITLLDANIYDEQDEDQLAITFIKQGMKKIPFVPSGGNGKAFVLGFAFERGEYFYGASEASAGLSKQLLGEDEWTYLHFTTYARNLKNKQLKKNLRATFSDWEKVKIEYRELPVLPLSESLKPSKNTPKESHAPSPESSQASASSSPSPEPSQAPE